MAEELTPDVCVVGGGPGGVAVALAVAAENVPVVLIERRAMGGANLAWGAVPTRALITAAATHEFLRRGPALGVTGAPLQVNFGKVREHIGAVTAAVAATVAAERLTALGVRVVHADARFTDANTVAAGDVTVRARRFVLAVGSVPASPDLPGLDGIEALSAEALFDLTRKIGHLIVLGATRSGCEIAQTFSRLGIDATVIDDGPPLADDDPEMAAIVVDRLRAEGVRVRAPATIRSLARRRGGVRLVIGADGEEETAIDGSHLFVAAGRAPAVDGLDLAAAGIAHDRAGIAVDKRLRTTNRRVYAIGDAIAGPPRVARAEHEAAHVVRAILLRRPFGYDRSAVPILTDTDPALARVGLDEAEARRRHGDVRVLRYPFAENDLAQAERLPQGVIKVVTTKRGRILGAGIVGHGAAELIAPWSQAIATGLTIAAMAALPTAYPARCEVSRRVAATFSGPGLTSPWRRYTIDLFRKFG
jgi:pyruvate/2-oxoglutarate dehydrogenase complex dihydrolipoamide dehydrogenase (E3) component